jgi:hypothetical protein
MTIVHRNTSDSEKRRSASIAAIPAISVPAPIAVQNSFSALQDDTSDSDVDMHEFDWKSISNPSETELSDTNDYENVPTDDSVEDSAEDSTEDSAEDNTPNSVEDSTTDSSSDSSHDEVILNNKHYRRVRQPWCKDGVPCVVTSLTALLAFAYFMQFVFYMCGLVGDDCCSPSMRLECSKGL